MKALALLFPLALLAASPSPLNKLTTDLCSLLQTLEECKANSRCLMAKVVVATLGNTRKETTTCYNKQFLIRSVKAHLFPQNFHVVSDDPMGAMAYLPRALDFEKDLNIDMLINRLINLKRLTFLHSFELVK